MTTEPDVNSNETVTARSGVKWHPWRWVAGAAVVHAVAMCSSGWRAVIHADHAERSLHGMLLTLDLVTAHVREHGGKWPRSWSDLELQKAEGRYLFRWPEDAAEVRKYVDVDFEADPAAVAKQSRVEFKAVRPMGPSFSWRDRWQLEALLTAVREFEARSSE